MPESVRVSSLPHLLVVDDEQANADLLAHIFREECEVFCASDAMQAMDLLHRYRFDVVLLDILMPVVNGMDLLRKIRETPELFDLPVILMSSLGDSRDIVLGLQNGGSDYITKPYDVEIARARVRTQISYKRLADEHKQIIHYLEEANATKQRFMQIASHDLKGPLGNLGLTHHLLRELVEGMPEALDLLDVAENTVAMMRDVIEQFLDMTMLRDNSVQLTLEPVALPDVMEDVAQQYELQAGKKEIRLDVFTLDVVLRADIYRLKQILSNLVSNAIKYSPAGTVVSVYAQREDNLVRIAVQDQGSGIPEAELNRLFQPFSKLSPRPTAGESSTGLGLWIVKQLVNLHGGEIGVHCPEEGGSIFWVTMPLMLESTQA